MQKLDKSHINQLRYDQACAYMNRTMSLRTEFRKHGVLSEADHVMTKCLFHEERVPSLSISFDDGAWYCFSCQRGGGVIQLIQAVETLLNHNFLNKYSVIEYLLTLHPEFCKELGFNSIRKTYEEEYSLPKNTVGELVIEVPPEFKPQRIKLHDTSELRRMLRLKRDGQEITDNQLLPILDFISCASQGYSEEYMRYRIDVFLQTGEFPAMSSRQEMFQEKKLSDEQLDDLLNVFMPVIS